VQVTATPLPFRPRGCATESERFAAWCKRFVKVPKGTDARKALILRDWQTGLVGSVLDAEPRPRIAGWTLPRGQGKSTLVAALGLWELLQGGEGATVIVAAVDERQAGIIFGIARRMVELSEELSERVVIFKDRLTVPSRGASFQCLPSTPSSLEGLDYTLAICDECGVIDPDTWSVIALASGKRERSTLIGIGTPGIRKDNVLAQLRAYADEYPDDPSQVYREFSAAGFEDDHPVDCEHCWALANPALDDFLYRDGLRALLPPATSEGAFRRARLCQPVDQDNPNPFVPADVWASLDTGQPVPDGAEVVIGLDGSFGGKDSDLTALVLCTVGQVPHVDLLACWSASDSPEARIPILAVEDAIRNAHKRFRVREVVADPFRWSRTLQVLSGEGIRVAEFPWSTSRVTKATGDTFSACMNNQLTHSGDPTLTAHVMAATVIESPDGALRIGKTSRKRHAAKIDCAAAFVMAHSRALWLASKPKQRKRVMTF
jgi:phage terminase large subunit-like protein